MGICANLRPVCIGIAAAALVSTLVGGCGGGDDNGPSAPSITILAPTGGEKWVAGSVQRIEWQASGVQNVHLEISWDGGGTWEGLSPIWADASLGSVEWTVDTSGRPLSQRHCVVRVSDWFEYDPAISSQGGEFTVWSGTVWYVDDDASAGGDGTSWAAAFQTPQEGVDAASAGDEVWVAAGTYSIGTPASVVVLKDGVGVYGGFAGDETAIAGRDVAANETVLDGYDMISHVVQGASNSVLDGFTVTRGNANSSVDGGGGIYAYGVNDLCVARCILTENHAYHAGGGGYVDESRVRFAACVFSANTARSSGGGLELRSTGVAEAVSIGGCTFTDNMVTVSGSGGAIQNMGVALKVSGCRFLRNAGAFAGGAVFSNTNGTVGFANCLFAGNASPDYGGAASVVDGSLAFEACTFVGNRADGAAAVDVANGSTALDIVNCVFWGNVPGSGGIVSERSGGVATVAHSCVQGGWPGEGNITADPLFVAPGHWDDAGTPGDTSDDFWVDGDYHLSPGSPCIDRADGDVAPASDIDGNPRHDDPGMPNAGRGSPDYADIGAYEFQGRSEITPFAGGCAVATSGRPGPGALALFGFLVGLASGAQRRQAFART